MEKHPQEESGLRNKHYLLSLTGDYNPVKYLWSYQLVKGKHNIYVLTKSKIWSWALKTPTKSEGKLSCVRSGAPQTSTKALPRVKNQFIEYCSLSDFFQLTALTRAANWRIPLPRAQSLQPPAEGMQLSHLIKKMGKPMSLWEEDMTVVHFI